MPARDYPRVARLNHLIQEIVADELERIDDERLGLLTVVAVDVDGDLSRAVVWYTAFEGETDEHAEALEEHRRRLQSTIARQARIKRTPELVFRPDEVTRTAQRVESILRDLGES